MKPASEEERIEIEEEKWIDKEVSQNAMQLLVAHDMTAADLCRELGWGRGEEQQLQVAYRKHKRHVKKRVIRGVAEYFSVGAGQLMGIEPPGSVLADARAFQVWSPSADTARELGARIAEHEEASHIITGVQSDLLCSMLPPHLIAKYHLSVFKSISTTPTGQKKIRAYNKFGAMRHDRLMAQGNPVGAWYVMIPEDAIRNLVTQHPPYELFTDDDVDEALESIKHDMIRERNIVLGFLHRMPAEHTTRLEQIESEVGVGPRFVFRREMQRLGKDNSPVRVRWSEDEGAMIRSRKIFAEFSKHVPKGLDLQRPGRDIGRSRAASIECIERFERLRDQFRRSTH